MPELFGVPLEKARERVGALDQVARIDSLVDADGPARGTRRLRLVNGGGLEVEVHPDRALDIGAVTFDGLPLAWRSAVGFAHPQAFDPHGTGWLRSWGGGLVSTCGLDTFAVASTDGGAEFPMHGRIGAVPASVVRTERTADEIVVEGLVRQTGVFAENLLLHRRIRSALGSGSFTLEDTVTNDADAAQPLMVLYHVNLGWPLLDEGVEVEIGHARVEPRDPDAATGFDTRLQVGGPERGYREQVFNYETDSPSQRYATVTNRERGIRLALRYSDTLPAVHEWKMTATGYYALGIEPSNTPEMSGRAAARASGRLPVLEPGESIHFALEIEVTRL